MVRLRYEVVGEGPPVVLLNGIFQRLESWDPVLPYLEGYTLLRYDMRGQGGSEAPEGPYPPEVHAEDLLGL
ncbi:alpha/beta fold hydrolase, partial [Acinetobacter baumannii]